MLNKKKAPDYFYKLSDVRGKIGFKSATLDMGKITLRVAVINELIKFNKHYDELKNYDFIEVMACPGGCIGGGGQPLNKLNELDDIRNKRINSMYEEDSKKNIRESYMNEEVQDAYISYISKHEVLLHNDENSLQDVLK